MDSRMARVEITAYSDLGKSLIYHPWPPGLTGCAWAILEFSFLAFSDLGPHISCRSNHVDGSYSCFHFREEGLEVKNLPKIALANK